MTGFEQVLALGSTSTKHKLSMIYKLMLAADTKPFTLVLQKWGKDCNKHFVLEDWDVICTSSIMTTSFLPLKLQNIKLLHRWYLIPRKLQHIYKTTNAACWKGCTSKADYLHCWWQCPKIRAFWTSIIDRIFRMTAYHLQEEPEIILWNK